MVIEFIKKHFQQSNNGVMQLILINGLAFFSLLVIKTLSILAGYERCYQTLYQALCLSSSWEIVCMRPWTLITHCFVYENFWATFWELCLLYTFGKLLVSFLGNRQFIIIYLVGGIVGGLFFLLLYHIAPYFQGKVCWLVGPSASSYAVMVAAATVMPNFLLRVFFLGPVKLKYVVFFLMLMAVVALSSNPAGDSIAHLGGGLLGYGYVKQWQGRTTLGWLKQLFQRKWRTPLKVTHRPVAEPARKRPSCSSVDQATLDLILDKVAKSGYESLTEVEKHQLFNAVK